MWELYSIKHKKRQACEGQPTPTRRAAATGVPRAITRILSYSLPFHEINTEEHPSNLDLKKGRFRKVLCTPVDLACGKFWVVWWDLSPNKNRKWNGSRKARIALVNCHRTSQAECSQGKGQRRGREQWSKNEERALLLPKQRPIRNIIQIRKSKVLT